VIAYFDTSALVPVLVQEPASQVCRELWEAADGIVASQLAYVEAAAALAQGTRLGRLTAQMQRRALGGLEDLWQQMSVLALDHPLAVRAAQLADQFALRGYDAVHCASAEAVMDPELVAVSGDSQLLHAWHGLGIATVDVNQPN
jgi:predicted nucleic acid-binding protein